MDLTNSQEVRNVVLAISALVLLAIFPAAQTMIAGVIIGSLIYVAAGSGLGGIGVGMLANYGDIAEGIWTLLAWIGITVSLDSVEAAVVAAGLLLVAGGVGLI